MTTKLSGLSYLGTFLSRRQHGRCYGNRILTAIFLSHESLRACKDGGSRE